MATQKAVRAADFLNSLGVSTHIDMTNSQYRDIPSDLSKLSYLGVTHVRDYAPNPNSDILGQQHLGQAADAGIKFTFTAKFLTPGAGQWLAVTDANDASVTGSEAGINVA